MIAFGCATTDEGEFRAYAAPAIERVAEADSLLMRRHGYGSIHEPYNEMLEQAARCDELEAIVLLHQDLSIDDESFLAKVRGILAASPDIAVIGAAGASGVTGLAWWEGTESHGYFESPVLVPGGSRIVYSRGVHEVDSVDGMLLVLSAWAARELRFDGELSGALDGYDMDICLQARARGRKVVAGGLQVSHYTTYEGFFDRARWIRAAVALQRKWSPDLVPPDLQADVRMELI
jgi:Glycosyltransferase like family